MGYISAIAQVVGTGISLLGRSGSPDYPAPPKLYKLPVAKARKTMEAYEARRMQASIGAWKDRFPLLYKGGQAEIDDIRAQQQGRLGRTVTDTLTKSGLDAPTASSPEALGLDIGLNPLALSQRSSQAVMRQIAMNPEWTNKITGGTLASMMANANANANAFNGFLGAQRAAMYQQGQAQGAMNTSTLIRGVTGAAGNVATAMAYNDPNSPFNFFGSRAAAQDTAPAAVGNPPGGSDQRGYYNNTYGINDRYSGIPSNPWGNSTGYDYQPLDLTGDYGNYGNQSLTWGGTSNYGQFGFGGGR